MAEDCIHLFISLNKNINTLQEEKDNVYNHINLFHSFQNLPTEIFEYIMKSF